MAKEYVVMKDGEELKTYKSLPAAKTMAEKEDAEVYADGECVYASVSAILTDPPSVEEAKELVEETKAVEPEMYTLLHRMNVRAKPALTSEKVGVLDKGMVVEVEKKVDDWLHLTDGTFILYGGGKFAEKA